MANRAFLCCSNIERTYPSLDGRYRPELHTVAGAVRCVPLMWLALFVPDDLRIDVVLTEDGHQQGELAPLARRIDALERLDDAVVRLEKAYPRIGPLAEHARLFRQSLTADKGRFITIELDEIAWLARSRRGFDAQLRRALDYLASGQGAQPGRTLSALSGVDPKRRLIPPNDLYAKPRARKADLVACMNVLGMSHIRNVPWKEVPEAEAAAAPKRSRGPKRHIQLHEALHGGDEKRARALLAQGADPNRRHATVEFTMQYVIWRRVGLSFARELVAAGFDLSKRRQGYTAMQKAIWADAADVVAELLELGASPTQPDAFRRDPLALSAHAGAFACVELFLRRGPEPRSIQRAIRAGDKRLEPFWRELSVDEERNIRKALELLRAATE